MAAGLLHFEKMTAQLNYVPPHKNLDPIEGPIEHLAENLRSASDHFACTSLPTARGESDRGTSLIVVNDIVEPCPIVTLAAALQTQFLAQDGASQEESARYRRPDNGTFLLTSNFLESIGLDTASLPIPGNDRAHYTIYGCPVDDITELHKRRIAMVFTWSADILLRVNVSAILQPPIERPPIPSTESPALVAMLADTIPDFRRATDVFGPASTPETALMARFDDRIRPDKDRRDYRSARPDPRSAPRFLPRPEVRRDLRPDNRPASRHEFPLWFPVRRRRHRLLRHLRPFGSGGGYDNYIFRFRDPSVSSGVFGHL